MIMAKLINSLQTKLVVSFILLIVIISGLSFFYTYGETKKALKENMRDESETHAAAIHSNDARFSGQRDDLAHKHTVRYVDEFRETVRNELIVNQFESGHQTSSTP